MKNYLWSEVIIRYKRNESLPSAGIIIHKKELKKNKITPLDIEAAIIANLFNINKKCWRKSKKLRNWVLYDNRSHTLATTTLKWNWYDQVDKIEIISKNNILYTMDKDIIMNKYPNTSKLVFQIDRRKRK